MRLLTTALDLIGAALLTAFAYFMYPPAALAVAGAALLLTSWRLTSAGRADQ